MNCGDPHLIENSMNHTRHRSIFHFFLSLLLSPVWTFFSILSRVLSLLGIVFHTHSPNSLYFTLLRPLGNFSISSRFYGYKHYNAPINVSFVDDSTQPFSPLDAGILCGECIYSSNSNSRNPLRLVWWMMILMMTTVQHLKVNEINPLSICFVLIISIFISVLNFDKTPKQPNNIHTRRKCSHLSTIQRLFNSNQLSTP